ncbi:MAG TPA: hypothetical protein VNG13_13065 [Mycobacteriales bacterium]|nr:hypothetical protein [Mycobacteriales bacterium]
MLHLVFYVLDGLAAAAVLGIIVTTVVLVRRDRPPAPPHTRRTITRVRGRSIRGWQASVNRELRRAGRAGPRR